MKDNKINYPKLSDYELNELEKDFKMRVLYSSSDKLTNPKEKPGNHRKIKKEYARILTEMNRRKKVNG